MVRRRTFLDASDWGRPLSRSVRKDAARRQWNRSKHIGRPDGMFYSSARGYIAGLQVPDLDTSVFLFLFCILTILLQ